MARRRLTVFSFASVVTPQNLATGPLCLASTPPASERHDEETVLNRASACSNAYEREIPHHFLVYLFFSENYRCIADALCGLTLNRTLFLVHSFLYIHHGRIIPSYSVTVITGGPLCWINDGHVDTKN